MACFNLASITISRTVLSLFLLILIQYCSKTEGKNTPTHLHFYFNEILSGPNATVANVVNPTNNSSVLSFGTIGVLDDILKEGPDPSSKSIGRAQGLTAVTSIGEFHIFLTMLNFVFTDGPYNGSTLAVFGRVVPGTVFERSIVGGTGEFRMARGYILGKQLPDNSQYPLISIYEFDAYISH